MPLGKQAAAYTLASSFPDSCGKVQDAPPNPFSVFFPPALSIGFAFINTTPTFFLGGSFCVSHSLRDWGKRWGHPSAKMHWCITGESALAGGKISCVFRVVPPSLRAVWESPWGLNFHEIRNIKNCSHFFPRWELLCSHSLRDCEEKQDHPSEKMRRCITGESPLAGRKISCAFRIVPPSLRAVWESPWGLNFHEIRNIKHCSHFFSLRRGRE